MKCPTCELGTLERIELKKNRETGWLCDSCGNFWNATDHVCTKNGIPFTSLTKDGEEEYAFVDRQTFSEANTQDVMFAHNK